MNFKLWLESNETIMPMLFDKIKQLKGEYSGVHFSPSEQLSFNLNPSHYDPIGIYVFPKNYVLQGGLEKNQGFASKYYAFLIEETPNAKVLNLNMSRQTAEELLTKIGIDKSLLDSEEVYHKSSSDTPGHRFWGVLEGVRNKNKLSRNMSWNSFFSKTGYNALYDPGLGIIHSNEPTQVVYLDHKAYKVVDVIKRNNVYSLLTSFASYFPDFRMYKRSRSNSEERSLRLVRDNDPSLEKEEMSIVNSKYNEDKLRVKVYGFELPEGQYSKEWYETIKSKEDLEKLVGEVKNFISNTKRNKRRLPDKPYEFINKVSQTYNLSIDPKFPAVIEKRYRDNTSFNIKQSTKQTYTPSNNEWTSGDIVTLSIKKGQSNGSNGWISYFYYQDAEPKEDIEETIKALFEGIKRKIQEEAQDENSRRKYDAPHALKFVEFLENKVFVKR